MTHFVKANYPANDNGATVSNATKTLLAKQAAAIFAVSYLNNAIVSLLDGQGEIGQRAVQTAYDFTIACMDDIATAQTLIGWTKAAVQSGKNPYCQPLKLLAPQKDNIVLSKISIWAKVFRVAHAAGITPGEFPSHVKRNHGMRRWYDTIGLADNAANDNHVDLNNGNKDTGKIKSGTKKKKPDKPIDINHKVETIEKVAFAVLDWVALINDPLAQATLESLAPYVTLAQADDTACRKFLNDNDPRFDLKGVA